MPINSEEFFEKLSGKRILIVEDNEDNIFSLKVVFKPYNMDLTIAKTGEDAIDYFFSKTFDVILVDIRLPGIDGIEVMKRINISPIGNSAPIIAVTAKAMDGDREKILELGADEYVSKPIDVNDLLTKMAKFF